MTKKLKVVVIGAGSSYTPELIEGLIKRYDKFPVTDITLVDIEEGQKKLDIIYDLTLRMIKKVGLDIEVKKTLNRREALEGADFVVTQFRVGLLESRIKDERISIKHGIIGQETNGSGGMFKALRTVPVIIDIANDIHEICPEAWLINFTNPSGMVTDAIFRYSNHKKAVGLCNVPIGMKMAMAEIIGDDNFNMELVGLNHHFFVTDVYNEKGSFFDQVIDTYCSDDFQSNVVENIEEFAWSPALIRGLKGIPCPYFKYYFFTKEELESQMEEFKNNKVRAEEVKRIEEDLFKKYQDPNLDVKPKELELRGGAYYSDAACNLITSIYNDTGDIQYVNTLNRGAFEDYDDDVAFELACRITKDGPQPVKIGKMPLQLRGTVENIKVFERLCEQAAVDGDRDLAITALNLNPLVPSDIIANEVFDDLLEAHKKYLPKFL